MHMQVESTLDKVSILIIHSDEKFAHALESQTNLALYNSVITPTTNDVINVIQCFQPQVIIFYDNDDIGLTLFEDIASIYSPKEHPILIAISDNPTSDLFAIADQVIPQNYLPFIEPIVIAQVNRKRVTVGLEKQYSKLASENRLLNQQLEFANQTSAEVNILKQAIVHSVSHELRTPMLQVKSAVALLSEDENTNRNIVELATEATTRLEGGIRNVTLLNELMNESSNAESFTAVPIIQIIQAALRNLGRSWEHKKDIERVEIIPNSRAQTVLCDKQRLTTAIQLLLDNALKFSQAKVYVKVTHSGSKVTVSIQDRGIGIPKHELKHILEPFYQIDGSSTRRFGGMGIGLSIVQLILEQHCTVIQIESTQGKGSTFAFDLNSASD